AARALAAEAVHEGFDTIVAAGGDGTLNEVLNGIGDAPGGYDRARLATIPLGTVNVFAREIGMKSDWRRSWAIIENGRERRIDLPEATFFSDGKQESRRFVQMAGAGWDARAVEAVSWQLKKKIGQLAYVYAGFQSLLGVQARVTVEHPEGRTTGELVIIGNGRFYGGSFPVLHHADYADGLLDVCIFDKLNWMTLPFVGMALMTGMLFRTRPKYYFRARELRLTCPTRAALQLEGEPVGTLAASVTIDPKKLRVIVGRDFD
ncbi:MAG: YegS/Rv2252/BmrU family lipid kinase, partial [Verrucomicrobiales bacterium]|nr:YegS/Rv2252/BmrU family lipid kinase [Verrucomicrobiales bacterium]